MMAMGKVYWRLLVVKRYWRLRQRSWEHDQRCMSSRTCLTECKKMRKKLRRFLLQVICKAKARFKTHKRIQMHYLQVLHLAV